MIVEEKQAAFDRILSRQREKESFYKAARIADADDETGIPDFYQ